MTHTAPSREVRHEGEEGYLLMGLVVACFLLLLALSVAAPRVAKELERDKEVESEHRAEEYVRAIQLYYRRNGSYPTTVEQLTGAGMTGAVAGPGQVKYLRTAYKDPITRGEFRLIHLTEAQTQVKGFFGEPLPGAAPGVGMGGGMGGTSSAAAGMGGSTPGTSVGGIGTIGGGTPGSTLDTSIGGNTPGSSAGTTGSIGGSTPGSMVPGSTVSGTTGSSGSSMSSGPSSADASTFSGSKGAIVGVGSNGSGKGLVEWNGSEDIAQWEFLYDPRVEQLKAKVSILGGSPAANGTGSMGNGFAPAAGINAPATGTTNTTGSSGASGFGSGFGNGTSGTSGASGSNGSASGSGATPTQ